MLNLDLATWLRFVGWLVLGLIVYVAYGRTHSFLASGRDAPAEERADR
jgi:APA family basic amino acid/polyamine antiporter